MAASRYRHYITLQTKIISIDTYGEEDITWNDEFNSFAEIKPVRGNEYYNAQQIQSSITHKITMRYCTLNDGSRIKPSNSRIIYDDRIFNIQSIININERSIILEFMAIEEL